MPLKKFFGLAALAVAAVLGAPPGACANERADESALVTHVFDGDTILVLIGGREEKVRLLGVDAPETDGPYTTAEPLGPEASERTRELSLGKTVTLVYAGETLRDRYGRLLAYVILPGGRALNEVLIEEGLARAYRKFRHPRRERYIEIEARARARRAGIWAVRNPAKTGSGAFP